MIVTSFVYCDHIETLPAQPPKGQVFRLVDPIQLIVPYTLPGAYSFSISFGLQGSELVEQDNYVQLDMCDPDGNPVFSTGEAALNKVQNDDLPPENHGATLNLDLRNILFSKSGIHTMHLFVNRKEAGQFPIMVVAGKVDNQ